MFVFSVEPEGLKIKPACIESQNCFLCFLLRLNAFFFETQRFPLVRMQGGLFFALRLNVFCFETQRCFLLRLNAPGFEKHCV